MDMHTAILLGEMPAMETRPRTPPSSYAPNPRNHLCLSGSANLSERLGDLVLGLERVRYEYQWGIRIEYTL